MKKTVILSLLSVVFGVSTLFAQSGKKLTDTVQYQKLDKRIRYSGLELKFSPLYLVLGAVDLTFEKSLNQESAVGINVNIPFDKEQFGYKFLINPYYRYYFGKRVNTGFFMEGFGSLNSTMVSVYDPNMNSGYYYKETPKVNFALGVSLGYKLVTKKGVLFELNGGVGRQLIRNGSSSFIPRMNAVVGYRF